MSYREENGQVVLTMSREDYTLLLITLGTAIGAAFTGMAIVRPDGVIALTDRLNEGNPNYTPYEVTEK